MRYHALACDYDGTLADRGHVSDATVAALERVRDSGRKLLLVTGRELDPLMRVFPRLGLFDRVVAENGAVLYAPETGEETALADAPPEAFADALRRRNVQPLSVGRVMVATWEPHGPTVLDVIREQGLELQLIFNKGAVMVLPSGVNKATGLAAALESIQFSPHNVVGVGDAENDHSFLQMCECGVAVSNALPALKKQADWTTSGDHGDGVVELIERLLASDLSELAPRLKRHEISIGHREHGEAVRVRPYGTNILVAGTSGSGKSTFATGFMQQLDQHGYQYCIIDPEGDYSEVENAAVIGDNKRMPSVQEVMELLRQPQGNCVVNLVACPQADRPSFFAGLLPELSKLRARTGRPHWVLMDEAHHMLPTAAQQAEVSFPQQGHGVMLITVHPDHLSSTALSSIDLTVAIGETPQSIIETVAEQLNETTPSTPEVELQPGEAIGWRRRPMGEPFWFSTVSATVERRRHRRKYAESDLGEARSFYFRGREAKFNLRAKNLMDFIELAQGVDDETWTYHLYQGAYAEWFAQVIKDEELVEETRAVERAQDLSPEESRARVIKAIRERYTAPA